MSALLPLKSQNTVAIEYECFHALSGSSPYFRALPARPNEVTTIEKIRISPAEKADPQLFYSYKHCHPLSLSIGEKVSPDYETSVLLLVISDVHKCLAYAKVRLSEEKAAAGRHVLSAQIGEDKCLLKYLELLLAKKI